MYIASIVTNSSCKISCREKADIGVKTTCNFSSLVVRRFKLQGENCRKKLTRIFFLNNNKSLCIKIIKFKTIYKKKVLLILKVLLLHNNSIIYNNINLISYLFNNLIYIIKYYFLLPNFKFNNFSSYSCLIKYQTKMKEKIKNNSIM